MEIKPSSMTISNVIEDLDNKRLRINRDYQRNPGIWPPSAKSYFIDTILEGFPYPQVYLYQLFDKEQKKPYAEVIDGQQRLTTINDFVLNKFALTRESANFKGMKFADFDEELQNSFLSSSVEVASIVSGSRAEILEMFRRMNAYTVPLNQAEQRNGKFQGAFKWFVTDLSSELSSIIQDYKILTPKKVVRFFDVEFLTELCLALDCGIEAKTHAKLNNLYNRYDSEFPAIDDFENKIISFFNMISSDFSELKATKIMQTNNLHDLFIAATHLKFGLDGIEQDTGEASIGKYYNNLETAVSGLLRLADEIEIESTDDWVKDFVWAAKRSTTQKPQRLIKVMFFIKALKGELA